MSIRNLEKIFRPRRVAIVGASERPGSVGATVQNNMIGAGFRGVVYPVNPNRESVQGIQAYSNVLSLPNTPDLAIICTPAATIPSVIEQCGQAGIQGIIILSAGFREIGAEGKRQEEEVAAVARRFDGMRIIGPNCLGVIVPSLRLNASFGPGIPPAGKVAFVSQSGALCTSVLDWAISENVGFSFFVSIGNMLDVGFADIIDYFGTDPDTESILMYSESITSSRDFMSAARAFSRTKPLIAYKSGRFFESAQAATSHTGALAGEDAVYDAAFRRAGIERVFQLSDMFDCAELLARERQPAGPNLAILTNAGGPGVMATDALLLRQGSLAKLSTTTLERLNAILPPYWSRGNPVDVLGDAGPDRYADCLEIILEDPQVHAAVVILTPQAMTDATATARAIAKCAAKTSKPVLTSWTGGGSVQEGIQILNQAGLATYASPEKAVDAFMHLVSYARNRTILYETPRDLPITFDADGAAIRQRLLPLVNHARETLSEFDSKELLRAYGIPTTLPLTASSAEEAVQRAAETGYPVVMKIWSPDITHKTDVGGVAVNLVDDEAVRTTYYNMVKSVKQLSPEAEVFGVTIQAMVPQKDGIELILGSKLDPVFGAVILLGTGGTAAEVLRDRVLELPPLNETLARRMIESLRSWPLLEGFRGRPAVDLDKLIEVLIRFSYLVARHPEIVEMDINPLLATPRDVLALDARIVIDRESLVNPPRLFAHLAIRPYPEDMVRTIHSTDGHRIVLRPIKPEDEPQWHVLLTKCSPESIRSRFRYLFKRTTHEMATRYCFIDYDREMAVVAEIESPEGKELIGVGRLVADPGGRRAEYAVLMVDAWQGKGIGTEITSYCVEVAHSLGIEEVHAETLPDNRRMISVFRRCGFQVELNQEDGTVKVRRRVADES
jgi:acetyltransferase